MDKHGYLARPKAMPPRPKAMPQRPKAMPPNAAASAHKSRNGQWGSGNRAQPRAAASASRANPIINVQHTFAAASARLPNHKPVGHQIPKPKDMKRWNLRDETSTKYVDNHKKMLWKRLEEGETLYAEAVKAGTRDPHLGTMQKQLFRQYEKVWDMDHFCTISLDAKATGEPERWINMNQDQIDRNEKLLKEKWLKHGNPRLWRERLTELRKKEQREANRLAAAASARGGGGGDDTSDEELPLVDIADDDELPIAGTVIATAEGYSRAERTTTEPDKCWNLLGDTSGCDDNSTPDNSAESTRAEECDKVAVKLEHVKTEPASKRAKTESASSREPGVAKAGARIRADGVQTDRHARERTAAAESARASNASMLVPNDHVRKLRAGPVRRPDEGA